MDITKKNFRLIWDQQTDDGWFTRHDEVDEDGEVVNVSVDSAIGDIQTTEEHALEMAALYFECQPSEIEVSGR